MENLRLFALRLAVAVVSFLVTSALLAVLFASLALALDWRIPEGSKLLGPSSVFDRRGVPLARLAAEVERRPVPLEAISPALRDAVIATEDRRFYEHDGVDPLSVLRAVWNNVRTGAIEEGGSTITQQYVKNVYVGNELTLSRKVREAVVALQLEKERTKDQILEAYLNRVYFGDGAYGAEAAARTYFAKGAADLDLAEAATLASVLTNPSRFNPRNDPAGATQRRNAVLEEMRRYGFITLREFVQARATPLAVVPRPQELPFAPYFVEEVRRQLTETYGHEAVYNGGLLVRTTLDVERQAELERRVIPHLPADPRFEPALAAVDPRTGDIVAAWSGRNFLESQVDLAMRFGRPSGSTFKVFALATALEEGKRLASTYPAPSRVQIARDWAPRGGGCGGRCTLLEATVRSVNTVFAQVGRDVGPEDFTTMARRMGVRSPLFVDLPAVLGTSSVTALDMASAFGTLANDGVACPARVVLEVRNPDGSLRPPPDPRQPSAEELAAWDARLRDQGYVLPPEELGRCHRAVPRSVARNVTVALSEAVARGTGKRARIGRPQAGKTGTTDESRQVWFSGYTPELSLAVSLAAVGEQVPLQRIAGCDGECFGGELPAVIWKDVAEGLLAGVEPSDFPPPITDERVGAERRRLGRPGGGPGVEPTEQTEGPPPLPTETADDEPRPSPSYDDASPTPSPSRRPTPSETDLLPPVLPSPD